MRVPGLVALDEAVEERDEGAGGGKGGGQEGAGAHGEDGVKQKSSAAAACHRVPVQGK